MLPLSQMSLWSGTESYVGFSCNVNNGTIMHSGNEGLLSLSVFSPFPYFKLEGKAQVGILYSSKGFSQSNSLLSWLWV